MTGGLMQLVAYGAQDIYLTGNPMISYFKIVYRRHTNFALESINQTFNGTVDFGKKVSAIISRNGDLVSGACIQAVLPDLIEKANISAPQYRYTRWIDNIGHYLIKDVYVEIGGQEIDRHFGDWLEIWAQLTVPSSKMVGYRRMIGDDPLNKLGQKTGLQKDVFSSSNTATGGYATAPYPKTSTVLKGREIYIPLQFWFCRHIGLALPLISLQYHEVKISVEFRPVHEVVMLNTGDTLTNSIPTLTSWKTTSTDHTANVSQSDSLLASLWIDYIYLDTDERRRFAQVSHEYLIEQVQFSGDMTVLTSDSSVPLFTTIDLNFNHPVKELIWVVKNFDSNKEYCNFTDTQLPDIPPFTDIGLPDSDTNVIGLTGLPTGFIVTSTPTALTITSTADSVPTGNQGDGAFSNADLSLTGLAGVGYKIGDIVQLKNNADTYLLLTIRTVNSFGTILTVDIPAITHDSSNTVYSVVAVFRPTTSLVLDSSFNTATTTNTSNGLSVVDTYDRLNRLTNYDTHRPVNSNGFGKNPIATAKLKLNGHDRFYEQSGEYFNWIQCRSHTNIPKSPGINVYSFAISPETHQPSGTCNFSRIDNAQLVLSVRELFNGSTGNGGSTDGTAKQESRNAVLKIFAVNYNIFRIMNGMGGLAYTS